MNSPASDSERKAAALGSLTALYPWIRAFHDRPVRDYARHLFEVPALKSRPQCRIQALNALLEVIYRAAIRHQLAAPTAARICHEFEQRPVLQTGPHLLLIIDPEAYYTHVFSLLGLAAHGCSTYLSCAVSTVSLVERTRKGPGWLNVGGRPINIFGLGKRRMIGSSLLTALGPYRFELAPAQLNGQSDALARLRRLLPQAQFGRPAHAIKAANLALWPMMFGTSFSFLQLDDEDVADLVAQHLADGGSWLRTRLLENETVVSTVLEEIEQLAAGPWRGWFTRGTDFFWSYQNGKRTALRLAGGELVEQATGAPVARFAVAEIIERLRDRRLIPNMFVTFLVLAMLPGVRVLGGSHQPIYYPLMRYVLCRAISAAGVDADLRDALAADDLPGAWGHRVIANADEPLELLLDRGSNGVISQVDGLGAIPLVRACANMDSFTQDASWDELHKRLQEKEIAVTDAQWAFA
ncbi:hypothetical protein CYK37_00325 [Mesorhizobium loti]|nr:hypothetical protein [Mesorhizobium loti]PLP60801.1 hypothetical protein CYK37_00325 [Mesorhizobium loti]